MLKRPVFAANWKMHHGPSDARTFIRAFLAHYPRRQDRSVLFFPPTASLATVVELVRERSDIAAGVQNIHWEIKGAFTGETSAAIARDAGARVALVGHSERRHVFGETEDETAKKVRAAFAAGLMPMLCVGERLEERERGEAEAVVLRQFRAAVAGIEPAQVGMMLLAYEPVWAIGTGRTATPQDASAMHAVLRAELRTLLHEKAVAVPILYGGSVNRGNAAVLLESPEVDGLLVGGASLDAEGWSTIARS
jgi:triosephosphate isomerase